MFEEIARRLEKVLALVHDFLKHPFWPEHLAVGDVYKLQADDQDGTPDTGWFTLAVVDDDTVTITTERSVPDPEHPYEYKIEKIEAVIRRSEHPLVHQAMLYLALAFRIDGYYFASGKQKELKRTRSRRLQRLYALIDNLPWLPTLNQSEFYVLDDVGERFGILYPPPNDGCIQLGTKFGRIRDASGGGGDYHYTRSVMKMIAEAIRLEQEGGRKT